MAPAIFGTIFGTEFPAAAKAAIEEAEQNTAEQSAKRNLSWIWVLLALTASVVGYLCCKKRKSNNA